MIGSLHPCRRNRLWAYGRRLASLSLAYDLIITTRDIYVKQNIACGDIFFVFFRIPLHT